MPKQLTAVVKLQIPAGQATPGPPVGVALGPRDVNPGQFVQQFNERTRDQMGQIVGVEISIFSDRTFTFVVKSSPASVLLKKAAAIAKGSPVPNRDKVGQVTSAQLAQIAQEKMNDLNALTIEQAMKIIGGTARSMGLEVVD